MNTTVDALRKPIKVSFRQGGGGKQYPFIEADEVQRRLNDAFGHTWSDRVVKVEKIDSGVLVEVEITGIVGDVSVAHHGFGFAADRGPDPGDLCKTAHTNAIKNAAKRFGIGLYNDGVVEEEVSVSRPSISSPPVPDIVVNTGSSDTSQGFTIHNDSPTFFGDGTSSVELPEGIDVSSSAPAPQQASAAATPAPYRAGGGGGVSKPVTSLQINTLVKTLGILKMDPVDFVRTAIGKEVDGSVDGREFFEQLDRGEASKTIGYWIEQSKKGRS